VSFTIRIMTGTLCIQLREIILLYELKCDYKTKSEPKLPALEETPSPRHMLKNRKIE
jgi:hypothetical protein